MSKRRWPQGSILLAVQTEARNEGHPRPYRAALEACRPPIPGATNPQHIHRYILWSKDAKYKCDWYEAHREKRRREKSQRVRRYNLIEKNTTHGRSVELVLV